MNTEKILALAAAQEEHMTAVRRELHQHPEMGWHEERTTDVIERELRAMGLTNPSPPTPSNANCAPWA